jgi:CDP-4-dehydro-6-deoxyglucose reductase
MFKVEVNNNKVYDCDDKQTIFESALSNEIIFNHSCLNGRCRSCLGKLIEGEINYTQTENILSDSEKNNRFFLSCISSPKSDLKIQIVDISDYELYKKSVFPTKINSLEKINDDIMLLDLRLPLTIKFKFHPGQYVDFITKGIKRSYSIASFKNNILQFYIRKYENGVMSNFLFHEAKNNDLLRLEGPIGSFFLKKSDKKNIIFLATGTGIAPIKCIIENYNKDIGDKNIYIFWGQRYVQDFFWTPKNNLNINLFKVSSREKNHKNFDYGYVQNSVLEKKIDLEDSQVYACGSLNMINESKKLLVKNGLDPNEFYSDAFVESSKNTI